MKKDVLISFGWALGIVAVSLAAAAARRQGLIDEETMLRVVAMNGLMVAYYGNLAPKAVAPSHLARRFARFSGWAMVLGGLLYAGFWVLAPIPVAVWLGTGALALSVILTASYCGWLYLRSRRYGDTA